MFNFYYNDHFIKDTTDPIYYSLLKVDWRFFCTFTYYRYFFVKNKIPESEMIKVVPKMFFNATRAYFKLKNNDFQFYCIHEKDTLLKTHMHCLISSKCSKHINYFRFIEFAVGKWNSLNGDFNTQKDIRLVNYETKRDLVRYVSKRDFCPRNGIIDLEYFVSKGLKKELIKCS